MMAACVFCLLQNVALAQDSTRPEPRWWMGGGGGVGLVSVPESWGEIVAPGFDPDCGTITGGSGSFWSAGAVLERRDLFGMRWQLRAGVRSSSATLNATSSPPQPIARFDGSVVDAVVGQRLETSRTDLGLALLALLPVERWFTLHGGIEFSRALVHNERHLQVALSPSDLLLVNNQRTFELGNGELIPPAQLGGGVLLGAALELPISRRGVVSPEVQVLVPIFNEVDLGSLRSLRLGAGFTLRFALDNPLPPDPAPDTAKPPPPLRPPIVEMMTQPSTVGVQIDEYDSVEVLPLLNRVFFERGSAVIPERYHALTRRESGRFTGDDLGGSALDVYHDLLNIIGRRMGETPRATLRIVGYRAGSESGAGLTRDRAEAVRRYLVETWGIAERRITVRGGATPPQAARENTREGEEENARIEIESSDPVILSPWVRVFTQRVATPPELVFRPAVRAGDAPLARWQLDITQSDGTVWRSFSSSGAPPESIRWDWRSSSGELPSLPISLRYSFFASDTAAHSTGTGERIIPITYNVSRDTLHYLAGDSTIESYSLLLFDYDSASVSQSDGPLLEAIAGAIRPGAKVTVIGYTDSLGDADYNRRLAVARASAVASRLEALIPRTVRVVVDERGGERERFSYSTPEGRAHCRTVFILVRTPVPPRP